MLIMYPYRVTVYLVRYPVPVPVPVRARGTKIDFDHRQQRRRFPAIIRLAGDEVDIRVAGLRLEIGPHGMTQCSSVHRSAALSWRDAPKRAQRRRSKVTWLAINCSSRTANPQGSAHFSRRAALGSALVTLTSAPNLLADEVRRAATGTAHAPPLRQPT